MTTPASVLDPLLDELRAHLRAITDAPPELLAILRAELVAERSVMAARLEALKLLASHIDNHPEPPRNRGEADAVHGPTALGTQHDIGTRGEPLGSD